MVNLRRVELYWEMDPRQKKGADPTPPLLRWLSGSYLLAFLGIERSAPPTPDQRPFAVGIRCCGTSHRSDLWISDQRGWKSRDEYKLETACCNRSGECWQCLLWAKQREHPFCENGSQYCSSGNWALIKPPPPHVCTHLFTLLIISFIPLLQLFCHTHTHTQKTNTHTALCSQLNLCTKKRKKKQQLL